MSRIFLLLSDPPVVSLVLGTSNARQGIVEGIDVYFQCNVQIIYSTLSVNKSIMQANACERGKRTLLANPSVHSISWLFNEKHVQKQFAMDVNNSTLLIHNVKRIHSGLYRCTANNEIGQGFSENVQLNVNCKNIHNKVTYNVYSYGQNASLREFVRKQREVIKRNAVVLVVAPECSENQRTYYGLFGDKKVNIVCELNANPSNIEFEWYLDDTNSVDENSVNLSLLPIANQKSKSFAVYESSDNFAVNFTRIHCLGKNRIGVQREPCTYIIIPA
ncbi:B-cell receptor CD22-like protein, partial [Leptotrombidium deliense]